MADTLDITIYKNDWTLAVAAGDKWLLSNVTGSTIMTRKAGAKPSVGSILGHPSRDDESLNVDLSDAAETGSLYVRLKQLNNGQESATVVFTAA